MFGLKFEQQYALITYKDPAPPPDEKLGAAFDMGCRGKPKIVYTCAGFFDCPGL